MSPNPQQTGRVVAHTPFPNRQVSGLFHSIKAGLYRSESSLSAYCPTIAFTARLTSSSEAFVPATATWFKNKPESDKPIGSV